MCPTVVPDRKKGPGITSRFLETDSIKKAHRRTFGKFNDSKCAKALKRKHAKTGRVQYNTERGVNGIFEMVSGGKSKVFSLCNFMHDGASSGLSMKRFIADLAKLSNEVANRKSGFDANKPAPVGVTLQNMSLDMMEDLYVYAMGGRFVISPTQFPNRGYSAFLQKMHEEACKIARAHINQLWKADFRKKLDGYAYHLVD